MNQRSVSQKCAQRFKAILNTALGQEVETYLKSLPPTNGKRWGFGPILKDFRHGVLASPRDMLNVLKRDVKETCRLVGANTPVGTCIQTIARDITDAITPLIDDAPRECSIPLKSLKEQIENLISELPDNIAEFREIMERERVAAPPREKVQPQVRELAPINEVDIVRRRCRAITDEETHAEVGEILRRYEPNIDSGSDSETLKFDLARSSALTLQKISDYLDLRKVAPGSANSGPEYSDDEAQEEDEEESESLE